MPDIDHAELPGQAIEGACPGWVIRIKQEGSDPSAERVQCRLADLVRKAVADVDPALPFGLIAVVEIAVDANEVVVVSIAIQDHAPAARDPGHQTQQVERVAPEELRCPFEDEDDGVGGIDIDRVVQRDLRIGAPVDRDFMSQSLGGLAIALDHQAASLILKRPVDEHQPHDGLPCARSLSIDGIEGRDQLLKPALV